MWQPMRGCQNGCKLGLRLDGQYQRNASHWAEPQVSCVSQSRQERSVSQGSTTPRPGSRTPATALLIAPAAFHRVVYRMRLKLHLVQAASRLALSGLTLLMLSLVSAVLLILDFVFGTGPAVILAAATLSWFLAWWFLVPVWCRIRHLAARSEGAVGDPGD